MCVAQSLPFLLHALTSFRSAISSDQYFERGTYDAAAASEAQARLTSFAGQTSISSSQYFGRDEDEEGLHNGGPPAADGEWTGDFEQTAKEYYERFMANPDVQSGIESFRTGALKVRGHARRAERRADLEPPRSPLSVSPHRRRCLLLARRPSPRLLCSSRATRCLPLARRRRRRAARPIPRGDGSQRRLDAAYTRSRLAPCCNGHLSRSLAR